MRVDVPPAPSTVDLRRPTLATATVFALSGFLFAVWVSRLPATRDRVDAGPAELGLALLAAGLGSLLVMPVTGRLCARFGSRRVVAATALPACTMLVGLSYVPGVGCLTVGLLLFGAAYGAWDVSMNVHGSHVDRLARRDFMPRYHGCWSVGGIAGAGSGALVAWAGIGVRVHFAVAAALAAVTLVASLRWFLDDSHAPAGAAGEMQRSAQPGQPARAVGGRHGEAAAQRPATEQPRSTRLLTPGLVAIGLVTLCATCIEGAAADWLALYLTDGRGAGEGLAAAGYAVFAVAMATSRFSGTALIARLGRAFVVRVGGLVTGTGILVTVAAPGVAGALVGALMWGVGVAIVFPAAMSAGGEVPGRAADGIAAVSTIGYGGFLLGPPLIGLVAEHTGLGLALLSLVPLAAGIVLLAPAVRPGGAAPAVGPGTASACLRT